MLTSHSSIAKAKIVNTNGIEIDPSSSALGKLVIETADPSYNLVIQGGDFVSKMGFNDLFNYDQLKGSLSVNQEITEDVSKLSIGKVKASSGIDEVFKVGDQKASASMLFAGLLIDGDTIEIDDIEFTFRNAPVASEDVDLANALPDLIDKIKNHSMLKNLVDVSFNQNTITVIAKAAGESGNSIGIVTDLTGGATVSLNGEEANGVNDSNLDGGTDKSGISRIFNYDMKPNSKEVFGEFGALSTSLINIDAGGKLSKSTVSLSGLATIVTGIISNYKNTSEKEANVAATVLEVTDQRIKSSDGINGEREYMKAIDLNQMMNTLSHLISMMQNTTTKMHDTMFSG